MAGMTGSRQPLTRLTENGEKKAMKNNGTLTVVGSRASSFADDVDFVVKYDEKQYTAVVIVGKNRTIGIDATTDDDIFNHRLFVDQDYDMPFSRGFMCDQVEIYKNGSLIFGTLYRGKIEFLGSASIGTDFKVQIVKAPIDPDTRYIDPNTIDTITLTPKN